LRSPVRTKAAAIQTKSDRNVPLVEVSGGQSLR
jgi:hypothetical protein